MSDTNKPLVAILDSIGRTIIGKKSNETDTTLSLENPSIVHVVPNQQTNQLQLQLIPIFFKEFLQDQTSPTVWTYTKTSITISSINNFVPQFISQYEGMWNPPATTSEPQVVKLFDDE